MAAELGAAHPVSELPGRDKAGHLHDECDRVGEQFIKEGAEESRLVPNRRYGDQDCSARSFSVPHSLNNRRFVGLSIFRSVMRLLLVALFDMASHISAFVYQ
jgi:hypothetical protein